MECSKCGSKLEDGSTFCPFCGNKIKGFKENSEIYDKKPSTYSVQEIELLNSVHSNNFTMQNKNISNDVSYQNLSTNSLIFGILSFFFFPCSIIAICIGISFKRKTNKTTAGFILGIISLVLQIIMMFFLLLITILSVNYGVDRKTTDGGSLKDYYETDSSINYQIVGNDEFGYLTVENEWKLYNNLDSTTLQYAYKSTSDILTMYAIKDENYTLTQYAESVKSRLQTYETDNISYEIVNVGQYKAIKQQAYLKSLSTYMTTWCFKDENDTIHYISINSDNTTNHQDIVTTFKLKK